MAANFEVPRFPDDLGKAAGTARFLIGGLFLGEAKTRAEVSCGGWNLAGFALGMAFGQPGSEASPDGVTIFRLRAALVEGVELYAPGELHEALEEVAKLGEAPVDDGVAAMKQISAAKWIKLALSLLKLFEQLGE